jgi:hypothetical protein
MTTTMIGTRARLLGPLAIALLAGSAVPGCFFDPDVEEVVQVIEYEIGPAEIRPEARVRVGRGLLTMAKAIVGLVDDPDARTASSMLRGINEIHVGVYEVNGLDLDEAFRVPDSLRDRLARDDWSIIVDMHSSHEAVWILTQTDGDDVDGLFVVSISDDELVVVKLEGDLSRTVDAVIREAMRQNTDMLDPVRDAAGV